MDENRLQSYLNVINQLLTCDRGQEPEILRQNQDLIDAGLVQAMEQVAGVLVNREAFQQAEWLRQLANQLDSALPTPPLLDQKDKVAYRRVRSFEERFGKAHLYLAYHAAFPLALTPDLLYKIWANFHRDIEDRLLNIPWEAVADVLLSGLCKEVGGEELYEMDLAVRNLLLGELKENPWFGAKRIEELSEFLLGYVGQQVYSDDPDIRDFARVQKWTALAYIKPDKAARELALALREKLQEQNKAELVRMASVVDTLAEPLAGFEPLLVYSRGMGKLARGDSEGAFVQFRELGESADWVRVKGISLPVPGEGGADGSRAIEHLAWRLKASAIGKQVQNPYIHLIQLLLNCPYGEEPEILKSHQNLVDIGLVTIMERVATAMVQQGEKKAADFFLNIAHRLAEAIRFSKEATDKIGIQSIQSQKTLLKAKTDANREQIRDDKEGLEREHPVFEKDLTPQPPSLQGKGEKERNFPSVNIEEVLSLLDKWVAERRGKGLELLEKQIFLRSWEGQTYEQMEDLGYSIKYIKQVVAPKLWTLLSEVIGEEVTKKNLKMVLRQALEPRSHLSGPPVTLKVPDINSNTRADWDEAPDASVFYGRTQELTDLKQLIVQDRCRLVVLSGMAGIGKTILSVKLAQQIQNQFDYVIWRSLRLSPPVEEVLANLLQVFSHESVTDLPTTFSDRLSRLIEYLRSHRCLLVLDAWETVLNREEYEEYGELLRRLGEYQHQSCLLLTSREKPGEITLLESETKQVRCLSLKGLEAEAAREILRDNYLSDEDKWEKYLLNPYKCHPLALKIVAGMIKEVFSGKVTRFLKEFTFYIDERIESLLHQQFNRLSVLEKEIMYGLARANRHIREF